MAQYIEIIEIAENGEKTRTCSINYAEINKMLSGQDNQREEYPWIATIDEYGNTVFNSLQIPLVIRDLEKLRGHVTDKNELDEIEEVINFLPIERVHHYIKFIGD